jgi:hypothetical protein
MPGGDSRRSVLRGKVPLRVHSSGYPSGSLPGRQNCPGNIHVRGCAPCRKMARQTSHMHRYVRSTASMIPIHDINNIIAYMCRCQTDINECASNNGRGPCQHTCTNTPGSFVCRCRQGYIASQRNRLTCSVFWRVKFSFAHLL